MFADFDSVGCFGEGAEMSCDHVPHFHTDVQVERPAAPLYIARVTVRCTKCGMMFQVKGLPVGCGFDGAYVSPDKTEARFVIQESDMFRLEES